MSQSKFALPRNGFTFKQFFVAHDRCAMKVGTDGILLGAWAPIAGVKHVLDIGAGSGLLALMPRSVPAMMCVSMRSNWMRGRRQAGKMPLRRHGLRGLRSVRSIFISGSRRRPDAIN